MTSPWKDGIASDLEDSPPAMGQVRVTIDRGERLTQTITRDWYAACDCAVCRAIVALVEEESDASL